MADNIKFALNENTIFQCDLIEYLDACKKAGFEAVEISYAKLKDALRFISKKKLVREFRDIEILSLNAFEDVYLVPDSGLRALEAEATLIGELCSLIECPAVVAPSGRWYQKYGALSSEDDIIALYRSRLAIIVAILDQYNIEVMFEPIAYPEFTVGEPDMVNSVLDGTDFNKIKIVPDIHNLYFNGLGPKQLSNFKADIGIFHIDDTPELPVELLHVATTRVFPGDGIAEASEWINNANSLGYSGYYSLELFDDKLYKMNPKGAAEVCMKKLNLFAASL